MSSDAKTIQYLQDAHTLEGVLRRTLVAHIAVSARGEHRRLLQDHLTVTSRQERDLATRLAELGADGNPVLAVAGKAKQVAALAVTLVKGPADALRGPSGDDVALRNAQDECASEQLEIAVYDALEAIAEANDDEATAELARRHREEEQEFLEALRDAVPDLARNVVRTGAGKRRFPLATIGLVDGARALVLGVQTVISPDRTDDGPQTVGDEAAEDPGDRAAAEAKQEAAAKRPQRRAAKPAPANPGPAAATPPSTRRPAAAPAGVKDPEVPAEAEPVAELPKRAVAAPRDTPPLADYDDMTPYEITEMLDHLPDAKLEELERYERANASRDQVLEAVAGQRAGS
ncbi:hypothetical protein DSM112329_03754 [Paraconexibacter sp. AEG42_29]|uniref:DUF892 family protein n=1 Tax=Paraconexibacter sp. AEG42_29 TaxID=2997339 RepID=A0AAU7AZ37_9ACTN